MKNNKKHYNYTIIKHGIHFTVDYYVELIGILSILCDDQDAIYEAGVELCNKKYVADVREYFKNTNYKPLTKAFEALSEKYYFNCDAPIYLALKLSYDSQITNDDKKELFYNRKAIPDNVFNDFIESLLEFEKTSNFKYFFKQHFNVYEAIITNYIKDYERFLPHKFLLDYLNIDSGCEYYINLMLGITNANYGVTFSNKVFTNNRPYEQTRYGDLPDYTFNDVYFTTLIVHEFAHSFINPMIAKHRERIQQIDIEKYSDLLDELCYGNSIETYIDEHVIRAIECIYVKKYFNKFYERYVNFNVEEGYLKLKEVINVLDNSFDIEEIIKLF